MPRLATRFAALVPAFLTFMGLMLERAEAGPVVGADELKGWRGAVKRAVAPDQSRHTLHAYFNTCPESPDGKYVLYYTSSAADGETGDLRVLERASSRETIIARDIRTEDAHRAACQQWSGGGTQVLYHNLREGRWFVHAVDIATGRDRVLAQDRQLGFGSATGRWVPVYGCHWNPGEHRNLELIDVIGGQTVVAVTAAETMARYGEWIEKKLGSRDLTIFFPVMSPDESKVFFKPCVPGGGQSFRGMSVSKREGKIVYDLRHRQFLGIIEQWGHPSWSPDSAAIFEKGNFLQDPATKKKFPPFSPSCFSDHPTLAPDGSLFVTDADVSKRPFGRPGAWAIGVGSTHSDEFIVLDLFDNTHGAKSWRHNHPHPAFSADGKRIYYNVNDGPWTRLMVAEHR